MCLINWYYKKVEGVRGLTVETRKPIPVKEAIRKVMKFAEIGSNEEVLLPDSYGRYLAEDLIASHDVPPFHKSPYDGFAIRAIDSKEASQLNEIEFKVIDEIGAGFVTTKKVGPFEAVRIMTGAQMPYECDAVVMLELTKEYERDGKKYMSIKRSFRSGDNVSFQGEDTKKGTPLVEKGTRINPGVQALLATFGYEKVRVSKKPLIGIFATGTELLEVNEPLVPGKIRNSNAYMVQGQVIRSGATFRYFGKLNDQLDECFEAIKNALDEVDILITTGGVSVGDYDYLPAIYERLGANVLFNKIGMRPGSVTTVAELNGKLLFGLSGNPSACYVGYELFVRPVVKTMLRSYTPYLQSVDAILEEDFPKPNPFTRFVRGAATFKEGHLVVKTSGLDKSNVVTSLSGANVLIVLPGGTRGFTKGDKVTILLLEEEQGTNTLWAEK
ncbi:molybdopterin molybdenumtransferase [Sutcliffiella cohnii]|uniref:Molybdopterin molybdenumtransferase n=1 Tax=Sutcliffiella cohnii TaxID=33932 RepID=A0A223KLQ7_9BACI|nr:gephyrin-like molybdotransferase Glp [Sutcliffiella cohnii]AST90392.1 molybdopterin molybdenumtransferase [Sutcliffiella cohnii]